MNVILFGAPGAGKGTQGALLAERHGLVRLATGDLLRDARRDGTALGREATKYMDAGELVPDGVILGMVREVMAGGAAGGFLFDGFPRTTAQADGLDRLLGDLGQPLDVVFVLDVDDETLVKRLSGRLSCPSCGAIYNRHADPPAQPGVCDRCGTTLVERPDDREETVRRRLAVYREQTAPVIAHYRAGGRRVVEIDGGRPVAVVQADLVARLGP
jgi:adenylate kinase